MVHGPALGFLRERPHDVPSGHVGVIRLGMAMSFLGLASYLAVGLFGSKRPEGWVWGQIAAFAPPETETHEPAAGGTVLAAETPGPKINCCDSNTSWTAEVISVLIEAYCARRSSRGTFITLRQSSRLSDFVSVKFFSASVTLFVAFRCVVHPVHKREANLARRFLYG